MPTAALIAAFLSEVKPPVSEMTALTPCWGSDMFRVSLDTIPALVITEAAMRSDIKEAIAALRKTKKWSAVGRPRESVLQQVDRRFIHHAEHYARMLTGGTRPDGTKYGGTKGIASVDFVYENAEASVVVHGSREWDNTPHVYETTVRFSNARLIAKIPGYTWAEKARALMEDNVRIHCSCDAFRFYHGYAATAKGFALVDESIPARRKNPRKRGGVCKHLEHALRYLPANYTKIGSALKMALTEDAAIAGDDHKVDTSDEASGTVADSVPLKRLKRKRVSESAEQPTETVDGVLKHTHNSEGRLIHPTPEGRANFHRWFGDSKAVDHLGRPLVVYHGTDAHFDQFHDTSKEHGVHYVTPDPNYGYIRKTDRVLPMYAKVSNPHRDESGGIESLRSRPEDVAALKSRGHDGVFHQHKRNPYRGPSGWGDDSAQFAVFHRNQLKSATGNKGAFSSTSDDLRESADGVNARKYPKPDWGRTHPKKIMYHATDSPADFHSFDTTKGDLGAHFGTLEQASHIAAHRSRSMDGSGMRLIPVRLNIKNPLRLKDEGSFHADAIADQLHRKGVITKEHAKKIKDDVKADWRSRGTHDAVVRQHIEKAGYDGVVYKNTNEGHGDSYIAFHPHQIKSAIGNKGKFDTSSPDMRESYAIPASKSGFEGDEGTGELQPRDADKINTAAGPDDAAEGGKAWVVQWAGGRAVCAFKSRSRMLAWAKEQGEWAEIVSIKYGEPAFGKDKKPVRVVESIERLLEANKEQDFTVHHDEHGNTTYKWQHASSSGHPVHYTGWVDRTNTPHRYDSGFAVTNPETGDTDTRSVGHGVDASDVTATWGKTIRHHIQNTLPLHHRDLHTAEYQYQPTPDAEGENAGVYHAGKRARIYKKMWTSSRFGGDASRGVPAHPVLAGTKVDYREDTKENGVLSVHFPHGLQQHLRTIQSSA